MKSLVLALVLTGFLSVSAEAKTVLDSARDLIKQVDQFEQSLPAEVLNSPIAEKIGLRGTVRDYLEMQKAVIMLSALKTTPETDLSKIKTNTKTSQKD